jgi:hypothetical protein
MFRVPGAPTVTLYVGLSMLLGEMLALIGKLTRDKANPHKLSQAD